MNAAKSKIWEVVLVAMETPLMMVSPVIRKNEAKITNHNNVLPDL